MPDKHKKKLGEITRQQQSFLGCYVLLNKMHKKFIAIMRHYYHCGREEEYLNQIESSIVVLGDMYYSPGLFIEYGLILLII